jgi:hypothetical protein
MSVFPADESHVIHVGATESLVARLENDARTAGMSVIRLDLAYLSDVAALAEYLAIAFMFPHETRGLDAAVDLISDLEWFGNSHGYLVVVGGLDRAPNVVEPFAGMLPNIVDWWRSQGVPFILAILMNSEQVTSALAAANRRMDEAGRLPWAQPGTGGVDVVVHDRPV